MSNLAEATVITPAKEVQDDKNVCMQVNFVSAICTLKIGADDDL